MLTNPLTSITILRWTDNGALGTNTIGNAALVAANWSPAIPTSDCIQLELGLSFASTGGASYLMQLRGSHDATTWFQISVRVIGAVVGTAQRWTALLYELGPVVVGAGTPVLLDEARPWAFHFLSIGFYKTAAPANGDVIDVVVERQRGGQSQQGA